MTGANITDIHKFIRELFGLFLLFWAILLSLSLFSFDAADPSFNLVKSGNVEVHNKAGLFGAYASGFLNDLFGIGALLWPLIFAALGSAYISARYTLKWWRWCGFFLLTLCLLMFASSVDLSLGDLEGGGMVGNALYYNGKRYLSPFGSYLLWFFVFLIGLQLALNFSWINLTNNIWSWMQKRLPGIPQLFREKSIQFKLPEINKISQIKPLGFVKNLIDKIKARVDAIKESKKTSTQPLEIKTDFINAQSDPNVIRIEENDFDVNKTGQKNDHAIFEDHLANSNITIDKTFESDISEDKTVEIDPYYVSQKARVTDTGEAPILVNENRMEQAEIPLPTSDLLVPPEPGIVASRDAMTQKGQTLMNCFQDFDIQGELVRITPGPVVTMYEVRPSPGIRVSRIANLSDDLSRALKAVAVRIQAPIPGTDLVGIEIPNDSREMVNFRELIESSAFQNSESPLTMVLGKDIAGKPYMADLAKMPHLLVAGATGAGKSVCLNSILISLLYRLRPDQLRLLLIDPKRIEMAVYEDLPHLIHPVVTEMSDAKSALDWAVNEMDRRYDVMSRFGVRTMAALNQRLDSLKNNMPPEYADYKPLPYLVIVVDELADLMMTAGRDVEARIVRLAQLARAAGIHLILATQRPSVDVVTGLIKANFNGRISFQVTSKHDSRTILDQVGAEHLLGRGDMLFKHSGGRLLRLHGPFLRDDEVQEVANYWKKWAKPNYEVDFSQYSPDKTGSQNGNTSAASDDMYEKARSFIMEQGKVSISLLQRHLNLGFNRAAKLVEQFERDGLIGPSKGSKPRDVIR